MVVTPLKSIATSMNNLFKTDLSGDTLNKSNESYPLCGMIVSQADMTTSNQPKGGNTPLGVFPLRFNHRRNAMKKYLMVVLLCTLVASPVPANSFLEEAKDRMLKCSFEAAKSEVVKRAKDKVYKRTRNRESIEDKLIRDNLVCAIKTIDSVFTYKQLFD